MEREREKQNKTSGQDKSRKGRRINKVERCSNVRKKYINLEYQTEANGKREGETE